MAKPTFPNAFSWKRGFLVNKSQRIHDRNVNKNELPKGLTNVACRVATITPDKSQRKIPTSHAVAMTASATSAATDPALLPASTGSEATFQTTPVRSKTENISAKPLSSKTKAPIPYTTAGFDEGDLHRASPIRGLPPEDTLHSKNAKEDTQFIKENSNSATTPPTNGQSQASQDSRTDPRGRTDEGNQRSGNGLRDDLSIRNPQRWGRGQTTGTKTLRPISLDRAHQLESIDTPTKVSFKDVRHPTRRSPLPSCKEEVPSQLMPNTVAATKSTGQTLVGKPFFHRYDLRLRLKQKNKQTLSEWEVFTTLLRQLAMIDSSVVLYPWNSDDSNTQPAIPLDPEPSLFFDLTIYAPHLVSHKWLDNSVRHTSIFLGSSITPASLVQRLDPWL